MTASLGLPAAFMIGLLGAGHCLAMCGGIGAALGAGSTGRPGLILLFNGARIVSYSLLGALVGLLGATVGHQLPAAPWILHTLAGLLLIAMGLYLGRWWMGLTRLESVGAVLWRRIQPWTRRLLPVRRRRDALLLGLSWGLLPCGLVYSTLSWALASAQPVHSALLMLAFGLGTLPAVAGISFGGQALNVFLRNSHWRRFAGALLILYGVWQLTAPLYIDHHGASTSSPSHIISPASQASADGSH